MKITSRTDAIHFTVKVQVVIPIWLRKEVDIEAGTRALVYADGDAIVLQPITAKHIRRLRGSLKGTGVLEALMEDRKRERKL